MKIKLIDFSLLLIGVGVLAISLPCLITFIMFLQGNHFLSELIMLHAENIIFKIVFLIITGIGIVGTLIGGVIVLLFFFTVVITSVGKIINIS